MFISSAKFEVILIKYNIYYIYLIYLLKIDYNIYGRMHLCAYTKVLRRRKKERKRERKQRRD
jgi:hypothetical protein